MKTIKLLVILFVLSLFQVSSSKAVDFRLENAPVRIDLSENVVAFGKLVTPLGDINGDRIPDFAAATQSGETGGSGIAIYFGKRDSMSWMRSLTMDNANVVIRSEHRLDIGILAGDFGQIISAGDLNGDNISDFAVTAPLYQSGGIIRGKIYIFYGKTIWHSGAADMLADTTYTGLPDSSPSMSVSIGNFNGDGYKDLLIYRGYPRPTHMYLFLGRSERFPSSILASDANRTWTPPTGFLMGKPQFVGDMNHDGFEEIVVVTYPSLSSGTTTITNIFAGNRLGNFDSPIALSSHHNNGDTFEGPLKVGDVNGDGYIDFLIERLREFGDSRPSALYDLIQGASDLSRVRVNTSFISTSGSTSMVFSGYGDINGDGISDLLFSISMPVHPGTPLQPSRTHLLLGRRSSWGSTVDINTTYAVRFIGDTRDVVTGALSFVGDINNGGIDDIAIGFDGFNFSYTPTSTSSSRNDTAWLYIIFGETLFPRTSPAESLFFPWIIYHRPPVFPDDIDPRPWPEELEFNKDFQELSPDVLNTLETDNKVEQIIQEKASENLKQ